MPPNRVARRNALSSFERAALIGAGLFVLVILFGRNFLFPLDTVLFEESYLQYSSYLDLLILSRERFGNFPHWSFHFGGGYPFVKHPENPVFSPLFRFLVFPFGAASGQKLLLLSSYAVGIAGAIAFGRRTLGLGWGSTALAAALFTFNAFVPFQINTGNVNNQFWLYLPGLFFLLYETDRRPAVIFALGSVLALLLLNGVSLHFAPMLLFLFAAALLGDFVRRGEAGRRGAAFLFALALSLLVAGALAAVKILPLWELLQINARPFDDYGEAARGALDLRRLASALLDSGPFFAGNTPGLEDNGLDMECVLYLGWIPVLLFAASVALSPRKHVPWLGLIVLSIWISMTKNAPVDLFNLLWRFPLFHSIHSAARYFAFPIVFLVPFVAAGFFETNFFRRLSPNRRRAFWVLALIGVGHMMLANAAYFDQAGRLQHRPSPVQWDRSFFQAVAERRDWEGVSFRKETWGEFSEITLFHGLQYFFLRQNIGLLNWYGNIDLPVASKPKYRVLAGFGDFWKDLRVNPTTRNGVYPDQNYRGEVFFAETGTARIRSVAWKSDSIEIDFDPGPGDRLVVNQNFDPDWRTSRGVLFDAGGRLAIALGENASGPIRLSYRSRSVRWGGWISWSAFAALLFGFGVRLQRMKRHSKLFSS